MSPLSLTVLICASLLATLFAQTPTQMRDCNLCLYVGPTIHTDVKAGKTLAEIANDVFNLCFDLNTVFGFGADAQCRNITEAPTFLPGMVNSLMNGFGTVTQACKDVNLCM